MRSPDQVRRHSLFTLMALLSLCWGVGCPTPFPRDSPGERGRRVAPVGALSQVPAELDLSLEAQTCEDASECVRVQGLPGDPLEALCCARCDDRGRVLNRRMAEVLQTWKARVDCTTIACFSTGRCYETPSAPAPRCLNQLCR